jgi:NAD(P)H-flavin reductase/ferredoxin
MPSIRFNDQTLDYLPTETVLQCLLRHRQQIPHGCQAGACQSCRVKVNGPLAAQQMHLAQQGLRPDERADGIALSCQLQPSEGLEIRGVSPKSDQHTARIVARSALNKQVWELTLGTRLRWQAGQYFSVSANGVDYRCYSASNLADDGNLRLQLRRYEGGQVSDALCRAEIGSEVMLQGPLGDFTLRSDARTKRILLLGNGTGLAPLLALTQHALQELPATPITLIHAYRSTQQAYHCTTLEELAEQTDITVASASWADSAASEVDDVLDKLGALSDTACYLSGSTDFVRHYQRRLFMRGASRSHIFCESFLDFTQRA